jgi:hypothetical protein
LEAAPSARELVADLDRLRTRTRERSRAWWFPLVLFGALDLLALPFHVDWSSGAGGADDTTPSFWESLVVLTWGGMDSPAPLRTGLYWFAALTIGYVGTGLYYRRHALTTGLRRPVRWFVSLGLLLTVFFLPVRILLMLPLWRTTSALVIVLVTVVVLAVRERDRRLWAVTGVLVLVTVLVNAYNVENVLFRLGVPYAEWWTALPNVALPGLVLLVGGLLARPRTGGSRDARPETVPA